MTQGKQVMLRNFIEHNIEQLGDLVLGAVALLIPVLALLLVLTT